MRVLTNGAAQEPRTRPSPRPIGGRGLSPERTSASTRAPFVNDNLSIPDVTDEDPLSAAIAYAEAGWYVGPVRAGTKNPGSVLGAGWHEKTSCDPEVIASWFAGTDHGVFLHVGRSGAVVLDIDNADDLDPRVVAAVELGGPFQSTDESDSRRGHAIFLAPAGRRIGNGTGSLAGGGLDIRGTNGVIVVAPSIHPRPGGRYQWTRTGVVPQLPEDIAAALTDASEAGAAVDDAAIDTFLNIHTADERPDVLAAHAARFQRAVADGESRHTTMQGIVVGAARDVACGLYPGREMVDSLGKAFLEALGGEREGRAEFEGMVRWAVGQIESVDLSRHRTDELSRHPVPAPPVKTAKVTTLAEVEGTYRKWFGEGYDVDVMLAVAATAAVEKLDGDPIWLWVVAASGNTKTESIAPLGTAGAVVVSDITGPAALLSGTPDREAADDATGGLLARIGASGVMVIKDGTSILSMGREKRAEILGALREIYDGSWTREVGTEGGKTLSWQGRLTVIGGVTAAWDTHHGVVAAMGDRFVLIRPNADSRLSAGRQAMRNTGSEEVMRAELGTAMAGLLAGVDPGRAITLTESENEQLLAAADIVTRARSHVEVDYKGEPIEAGLPEFPTRFAKQLGQVVRGAVAVGLDRSAAMQLAMRCARDSMPPLRLRLLLDVADNPDAATHEVRRRLDMPRTTVDRGLRSLHLLGLLRVDEVEEIYRGREVSRYIYTLAPDVDMQALVGQVDD